MAMVSGIGHISQDRYRYRPFCATGLQELQLMKAQSFAMGEIEIDAVSHGIPDPIGSFLISNSMKPRAE